MKNFLNRLGMTVLTAAMLTLPITGCGGSSDTGAAGSTSAAENASSAAAGSETDNDEIVKLRVWGIWLLLLLIAFSSSWLTYIFFKKMLRLRRELGKSKGGKH